MTNTAPFMKAVRENKAVSPLINLFPRSVIFRTSFYCHSRSRRSADRDASIVKTLLSLVFLLLLHERFLETRSKINLVGKSSDSESLP